MRRTLLLLSLLSTAPLLAATNPAKDLIAGWSVLDARAVPLLREVGFGTVLVPFGGTEAPAFARACREAGISPVAELSGVNDEAALRKSIEAAAAAGFSGVAFNAFGGEESLRKVFAGRKDVEFFVFLKPEQAHWQVVPAHAVLRGGRWPGLEPRDPSVASASESAWVDSNSYIVAWLRGLYPARPAILGYRPDEDAGVSKDRTIHYGSLELVLIDAFAAGGNAILYPPENHQKALIEGKQQAVEGWRSLARTARFLRENRHLFGLPVASRVAVAAGTFEQSGEILNRMYRRNVSPAVFPHGALPQWQSGRFRVLVAANIPAPPEAGRRRIFEFARGGGQVFTAPAAGKDPQWWNDPAGKLVRIEEEREIRSLGSGQIHAYPRPVIDVAEFALDVIDVLGMRTRDLRIWAADGVIGILGALPDGRTCLTLVNYGWPVDEWDFLVRVEGSFRKATFREPGAAALTTLRTDARGTGTEITVDHMQRLAVIELE